MSTFKKTVGEELEKKRELDRRQTDLHEKYEDVGSDVLIVEKPSAYMFTVKLLLTVFRVACSVILCVLAAVGVIALLYPETRAGLDAIFLGVFDQIRGVSMF